MSSRTTTQSTTAASRLLRASLPFRMSNASAPAPKPTASERLAAQVAEVGFHPACLAALVETAACAATSPAPGGAKRRPPSVVAQTLAADADAVLWPALQRRPQREDEHRFCTAIAAALLVDLAPADADGLPSMSRLRLPKTNGRGAGTMSVDTAMRCVIRSPYMRVLPLLFPPTEVNKLVTPPAYWLFMGAMARFLGSAEWAQEEIADRYESVIRPEFAAIGVGLPAVSRYRPAPGYDGFHTWRKTHLLAPGRLDAVNHLFTLVSLRLHYAIVAGRKLPDGTLHDPVGYQLLLCDSSLFEPPSGVYCVCPACGPDADLADCPHPSSTWGVNRTRAAKGKPRPHDQGGDYAGKSHGVTDGFHHVVVSAKTPGSYGRVVLAVDVDGEARGEMQVSMPLLFHTIELTRRYHLGTILGISYDGLLEPTHALEFARRYGLLPINLPGIHRQDKTAPEQGRDPELAGYAQRGIGKHRGKHVQTFAYEAPAITHHLADGTPCTHHVLTDDGAAYLTTAPPSRTTRLRKGRPVSARGRRKGARIPTSDVVATELEDGTFEVALELAVPCAHEPFTHTVVLTDSTRNSAGELSGHQPIAAFRHISIADGEKFKLINGIRNNAESLFAWLQKRFYHKDRASSWGRDAQLFDLLCAGILCNAETAALQRDHL